MRGEERPGAGRDARASDIGPGVGPGARPGAGHPADPDSKAPLDEPPGGVFPNWRALYLTLLAYTGLAVIVLLVLTHVMNAS